LFKLSLFLKNRFITISFIREGRGMKKNNLFYVLIIFFLFYSLCLFGGESPEEVFKQTIRFALGENWLEYYGQFTEQTKKAFNEKIQEEIQRKITKQKIIEKMDGASFDGLEEEENGSKKNIKKTKDKTGNDQILKELKNLSRKKGKALFVGYLIYLKREKIIDPLNQIGCELFSLSGLKNYQIKSVKNGKNNSEISVSAAIGKKKELILDSEINDKTQKSDFEEKVFFLTLEKGKWKIDLSKQFQDMEIKKEEVEKKIKTLDALND